MKELAKNLTDNLVDLEKVQEVNTEDLTYSEGLTILGKQIKILNDIKDRESKEKFDSERLELEKDKVYGAQNNEKDRLKLDSQELDFRKEIETTKLDIERIKLDIEKDKLALETRKQSFQEVQTKEERKWRLISIIIPGVIGLLTTVLPLMVYRKMVYTNFKLIYKDEGRSTNDIANAIKEVQKLVK